MAPTLPKPKPKNVPCWESGFMTDMTNGWLFWRERFSSLSSVLRIGLSSYITSSPLTTSSSSTLPLLEDSVSESYSIRSVFGSASPMPHQSKTGFRGSGDVSISLSSSVSTSSFSFCPSTPFITRSEGASSIPLQNLRKRVGTADVRTQERSACE